MNYSLTTNQQLSTNNKKNLSTHQEKQYEIKKLHDESINNILDDKYINTSYINNKKNDQNNKQHNYSHESTPPYSPINTEKQNNNHVSTYSTKPVTNTTINCNATHKTTKNSNIATTSLEDIVENKKNLDHTTGELLSSDKTHPKLFTHIDQNLASHSSLDLFNNIPTYTTNQDSMSFIFSKADISENQAISLNPENPINTTDNITHNFKKITIKMHTAQANITIDDNFFNSNPSKIMHFVTTKNNEILLSHGMKTILYGDNKIEPEGLLTHIQSNTINTESIEIKHLNNMLSLIKTRFNSKLFWIMHPKTLTILQSLQYTKQYFSPIIENNKILGNKIILINEMSNIYDFSCINKKPHQTILALIDLPNAYKIIKGAEKIKKIDTPYSTTYCTFKRLGGKIINPQAIIKLNLKKQYEKPTIN